MSTRSLIGKVLDDTGKCKVVYCHSDGYVKEPGVGWMLLNNYRKPELIDKLLDLGNLSSLGAIPEDDPELWKDYDHSNKCRTYKGRGDKYEEASIFSSPAEALKKMEQEYNYFFINGKWYYYRHGIVYDLKTNEKLEREGD